MVYKSLSLVLSSLAFVHYGYSSDEVNNDVDGITDESINDETETDGHLFSACNTLENGAQWIRPKTGMMDNGEEWPNIKVRCIDGWTILDYDLDSEISNYFSSFTFWTEYAASSSLDDRVTWDEWFLPANEDSDMQFRISENCQECAPTAAFEENSVYYMTGNYIGCLWVTKGYCDMDPDSLECYTCSAQSGGNVYSGLCTHMEASSSTAVYTEHDLCTTNSFNSEPSVGTNGEFCVCYKPSESKLNEAGLSFERETISTADDRSGETQIEIFNDDFKYGTYRITEPGTYILQEDIIFDMMAPDDYDSPNAENAWYPNEDNDGDLYEGSDGSFVGAYSMGFFAGFAIESHDVTIDLNGYEMKMSKTFHLQQRWFAHVEIGSKAFISGQGPGNFGAFLSKCDNIVIKNGVLGLSSHHGIHGNSASNIEISQLIIKDFEVAGIALNGFANVNIQNIEIGPCYQDVPVLGIYTQARIMLPRLRKVAEETNEDDQVRFENRGEDNRYKTAQDIEEALVRQMDLVFNSVIEDEEYPDTHTVWARAKNAFINENGIPSASTVYGIFLNAQGASVFAIGGAPGTSENAVIKNVKIHGLINDPWEVPRIMNTKGPFNDIVDLTRVTTNGLTDLSSAKYEGNAYTDAQYAIHELSDSWSVLSHSAMTMGVISWIKHGRSLSTSAGVKLKCNNDIMLHVTKGVFGLRLDSIDNFEVENVVIEDLQNIGYYGSLICGHYSSEDDGGHRNQRFPMQYGYTGTEIHGMSLVNSKGSINHLHVSKLVSARGDAYGLQIFPGNEVELGDIEISDIHAGAYAKQSDLLLTEDHLPNKLPRGCLIDAWTYFDEDDDTILENKITFTDTSIIKGSCVSAMTGCMWEYSSELITDWAECSMEQGNLIDEIDIAEGETYQNIENKNGGSYSGMFDRLTDQDENNDNGINMIPVDSSNNKNNGIDMNALIYVVVVAIILIGCIVTICRKCVLTRRRISQNGNNHTVEGNMKKSRDIPTYGANDAAERTPLITTGVPQ